MCKSCSIFSVSYSHTMSQHFLSWYGIICPHITQPHICLYPCLNTQSLTCGTNIWDHEVNLSSPQFKSIYCKWVLCLFKQYYAGLKEYSNSNLSKHNPLLCIQFKLFSVIKYTVSTKSSVPCFKIMSPQILIKFLFDNS